jgi:outer membrane beta-barrel protein
MNQARMGLLLAAALLAVPGTASAQGKAGKKPPKTEAPAEAPPPADSAAAAAEPAAAAPATEGDKPAEEPTPAEGGETQGICELDPSQCQTVDTEGAAKRPIVAQMYAVQQLYALRVRRFELNPYWSFTLNDQFVSHPGPGLTLNYYLTNVLAIGLNGNYYGAFNQDSEFNGQTRRAARVAVPLTEYNFSAALNFTYVPIYGKFAGFGDFIFHYDAYVTGGVGVLSNRPIAVVDPDNRTFDWNYRPSFNAGVGLRIFFNRWFAATLEVRDYMFLDKLENTTIATLPAQQQNKDTWYQDSSTFTNHVQAQLGVAVFLPFSWEYRLPK